MCVKRHNYNDGDVPCQVCAGLDRHAYSLTSLGVGFLVMHFVFQFMYLTSVCMVAKTWVP